MVCCITERKTTTGVETGPRRTGTGSISTRSRRSRSPARAWVTTPPISHCSKARDWDSTTCSSAAREVILASVSRSAARRPRAVWQVDAEAPSRCDCPGDSTRPLPRSRWMGSPWRPWPAMGRSNSTSPCRKATGTRTSWSGSLPHHRRANGRRRTALTLFEDSDSVPRFEPAACSMPGRAVGNNSCDQWLRFVGRRESGWRWSWSGSASPSSAGTPSDPNVPWSR